MSIVFATVSQLAQMLRDKEVSAVEVLDAYLKQIDKHNLKLNAIATLDAERARTKAREADEALARGETCGVLHGVPITIKDTPITIKDTPITIKDTFATKGLLTTAGLK